jgi:hypothetical protein
MKTQAPRRRMLIEQVESQSPGGPIYLSAYPAGFSQKKSYPNHPILAMLPKEGIGINKSNPMPS